MAQKFMNSKLKDSSSKLIFSDANLYVQFLHGYVDIPMLKEVQPGDIEDVTERYTRIHDEERSADIVQKVRIKSYDTPFYIISLIEHKSNVDYNVVMQVFRYITRIWEDYENEMEKEQKGISKTKNFKYPPILPIVFYDGGRKWTAATELHDRVFESDLLREYIPNYKCILVQTGDYSNAELIAKKNLFSFLMMMDNLRDASDYVRMNKELSEGYFKEIFADVPDYLLDNVAEISAAFLDKLHVPTEEVNAFTDQIKERKMGELFTKLKAWDVQETRRIAKEEAFKEAKEDAAVKLLDILKELNISKDEAKRQLVEKYELSEEEAAEKLKLHW